MRITFSKNNTVGKADPMLYGHFLEHFHRQVYGGVYDPTSKFADEQGFRTDVLEALKRIKTPIIRWPGGCYVSAYDWEAGVTNPRVATFDKAWRVEESNEFGTDEFVDLCKKIGCEPYICTNAGTEGAEDMSNWVEYCNLKNMGRYAKKRIANGYEQPHAVKFWSIGNENWGDHEIGAKDAEEWSKLVHESAKMMLRVDPTLELSAASIDNLDWNMNLLRNNGKFLDWISIHTYATWCDDGKTFPPYSNLVFHADNDVQETIDRVRAYLTACGLEKQIKIAYDEWNLRGWYHPNNMGFDRPVERHADEKFYEEMVIGPRNNNDVNSSYTMVDAVFTACFLNTCLRNCDIVGMACFSPVVNTRGAIFTYEDGIVLRPQYFVFELYANLMKDTVLQTWNEDVPTMTGIDGFNKENTIDTVDIVITKDDNGYAVGAVNKDDKNAQTVDLRMLDDSVSEMRIHTVNGPSGDSYNDIDRTEVGITVSEWMPYTGNITLDPHSVNVIEMR